MEHWRLLNNCRTSMARNILYVAQLDILHVYAVRCSLALGQIHQDSGTGELVYGCSAPFIQVSSGG